MSKTTPGPWKWEGTFLQPQGGGLPVLRVDTGGCVTFANNLRLVEAAPELLEALREFVEADGEYVVDPEYSRALIRRIEEG